MKIQKTVRILFGQGPLVKKLVVLVAVLLALDSLSISAQENRESIFIRETVTSEVLGEEVSLYISLPRGYRESTEKYPVLYVLDGEIHIFHVAGIADYLSSVGKIPKVIVIGIRSNDRFRDYTPDRIEHHAGTGGGARYGEFLTQELFVQIEQSYRVRPFRMIFGHSYGGTFVFNLLLTQPEACSSYIAASPNLFVLQATEERSQKMLKMPDVANKSLYISAGKNEKDLTKKISETTAAIQKEASFDLGWLFEVLDNENHGSTPHMTIYKALEQVFREFWQFDESIEGQGLTKRFKSLSERLGYEVSPPLPVLVSLGNSALGNERLNQAQSIFELLASLYPESEWGWVSLGSVFYSKGDISTAKESFLKALGINPGNRYSQDMLREIDKKLVSTGDDRAP